VREGASFETGVPLPTRCFPNLMEYNIKMTKRIESLKEGLLKEPKYICIERARWITEFYRRLKEKEPSPIHRASAIRFVLNKIPVIIYPHELIAGAMTEKKIGALLYPEFSSLAIWSELRRIHKRKINPFFIEEKDRKELERDIFPFWLGKTVGDYALSLILNKNSSGRTVFKIGKIALQIFKFLPGSIKDFLFQLAFRKRDSMMKMYAGFEPFGLFALGGVYILTEFAGISHVTPDYKMLVEKGLEWIIERASQKLKATKSRKKREFLEAVIISLKGVIEFAERYADEAERLAALEKNKKRREELLKIARNLRNSPKNPATSFHEALQAIWITQIALHHENYEQAISLGRIDQYLFPLYKKDIESGKITREEAKELLQCLWIKMSEFTPVFPDFFNEYFSGLMTSQGACIGGVDENGHDATNDLSYLILESIREVNTPQPNLFARIHKETPDDFIKAIGKNLSEGCPHPSIYNDEVIIPALMKAGVSLEDARDYAPLGCVEPNPQGKTFGSTDAALMNIALPLELALHNGYSTFFKKRIGPRTGSPKKFSSMEEILKAFRKQVRYIVKNMVKGTNALSIAHSLYYPSPLLSSLIDGTIEKGMDVTWGGAKYNFSGVQAVGVGEVADSLTGIEFAVFRNGIPLETLINAIKKNFEGAEDLRAYLLNKIPKYGEDEGTAERYAREVVRIYSEEVMKHRNPRGGLYIPGFYSITTHIPFGRFVGALPSGRKKGEPLSNGISPAERGCRKGPTAVMRSVAALDLTYAGNGVNHTMALDPSVFEMEDGRLFVSLLRAYFALGGMQVQFNVLSEKILREAQKNPDKYRWLTVRVAGYSAYFTELTKEAQEEIINRVSIAKGL